jgi:2-polyprenyl-3-methyl-5-hydroxy-6-metoxy-1,4-benzoquinol methylase
MINNIYINCPSCENDKHTLVYSYDCNAGSVLGKLKVSIVICDRCSLAFMNPRPSKQDISEHYESNSSGAVYHEIKSNSRHYILHNERTSFIEKFKQIKESGCLLDVGCGQGGLLKSLNVPSWEKYGLDPIQNETHDNNENIHYINGYIESYNTDIEYNIITCISSLEHYYNPNDVVNIFNKLLVNKGILILEVPDSLSPISQISEFYSFEHLSHFTEYSLTRMLNNNGFQVIQYDKNVSIPNLRVAARKYDTKDDKINLIDTFTNYNNQKKQVINSIKLKIDYIIEKCIKDDSKLAVYGAGIHTNFLFDNLDFESTVELFIDSDPKKWGMNYKNKKIIPPEDIRNLKADFIIISSHDYENEIQETINKYNINKIPVISLYT